MALTVMNQSTDDVYTTTAYVKNIMSVTGSSDDASLNALISAASRWAEAYVGFRFTAETVRETVPTFDSRRLMLNRSPIRAVKALYEGTDTGDDAQLLTSEFRIENRDGGLLSRDEGWKWTVPVEHEMAMRPRSGQEYKPWLIDYVAGWTHGGMTTDSANYSTEHGTTSTARTLPSDLEHAVALKVVSMYRGQDSARGDIKREKIGDVEVEKQSWNVGGVAVRVGQEEVILMTYRRMV